MIHRYNSDVGLKNCRSYLEQGRMDKENFNGGIKDYVRGDGVTG